MVSRHAGLKGRLAKLERAHQYEPSVDERTRAKASCEELYQLELAFGELELAFGEGPLIVDEARGEIRTPDGRLALSREGYLDVEALFFEPEIGEVMDDPPQLGEGVHSYWLNALQ